jgi:hypothetical protein
LDDSHINTILPAPDKYRSFSISLANLAAAARQAVAVTVPVMNASMQGMGCVEPFNFLI